MEQIDYMFKKLELVIAALDTIECNCSIKERDSGHLSGCFMPRFEDYMNQIKQLYGD